MSIHERVIRQAEKNFNMLGIKYSIKWHEIHLTNEVQEEPKKKKNMLYNPGQLLQHYIGYVKDIRVGDAVSIPIPEGVVVENFKSAIYSWLWSRYQAAGKIVLEENGKQIDVFIEEK